MASTQPERIAAVIRHSSSRRRALMGMAAVTALPWTVLAASNKLLEPTPGDAEGGGGVPCSMAGLAMILGLAGLAGVRDRRRRARP